ncbi:flavin-containing monooxygenase [Salipiger mangrovisoli]|uniref:NAD(P)-binding domain-containing protein n=1 Tax=Salipiger mangrovisoli TaxID=2865933 RepID=A0ABR9X1T0_9RHOB|nr:NAD(P)/FAD-dependent oxidoreductase [Salipiger mangrovisoli]MBE9637476.1 NAD(P)-binding domain-containing protein [Salipiger mangrovisoli]
MSTATRVLILGAGQAGLALSWSLSRRGIDHILLERGRVGERWQSERWPGLHLLTPNWMNRLPGPWAEKDPSGFISAAEFGQRLDAYRKAIAAPVVTGCEVQLVERESDRFRVIAGGRQWFARAVVIATGACDLPAVPEWAAALPKEVTQVVPTRYRGAQALPQGGVLVVGASATGVQLAAEIRASGRPVTLAVGRHVRCPRRYRGREIFDLLQDSGFLDAPRPPDADAAQLLALPSLQLTGSEGGGALGLDRLRAMGVRLVGRALGAETGVLRLDPALGAEVEAGERRRRKLLTHVETHLALSGSALPADADAWRRPELPRHGPERLDLAAAGIRSVIWATGFRRAYPWLQVPVLTGAGELETQGGRTAVPGLYALGLPFQRHRASAFIHGVGRDAEALAPVIAAGLRRALPRAA